MFRWWLCLCLHKGTQYTCSRQTKEKPVVPIELDFESHGYLFCCLYAFNRCLHSIQYSSNRDMDGIRSLLALRPFRQSKTKSSDNKACCNLDCTTFPSEVSIAVQWQQDQLKWLDWTRDVCYVILQEVSHDTLTLLSYLLCITLKMSLCSKVWWLIILMPSDRQKRFAVFAGH